MQMLRLAALFTCMGVASAWAQPAAQASNPADKKADQAKVLILDVAINGQRLPGVHEVGQTADGHWTIPRALWNELRLGEQQNLISSGPLAGHVALNHIAGLGVAFNAERQSLMLAAPANAFTTYQAGTSKQVEITPGASGTGAYANYDFQAGHVNGQTTWSGGLDLVGFGPGMRVTNSAFTRPRSSGGQQWLRLDTTAEFTSENSIRSLRIGDQVTSSGLWGKSARIGGIGFGTRYAMRPSFVTFALPSMRGEAILPSTIDVLVNQTLVASEQVPAGPFEWDQLPVVTGQGDLRLTVTDLQGRKTEIVQPYLVSDQLLRPGLTDYSVEFGRVRKDYGYRNAEYGRQVLLAQHRAGISERFTSEVRAEALRDQTTVGVGAAVKIAELAVVRASAAASRRDVVQVPGQGGAGQSANGNSVTAGVDVPGRFASFQARSSRSSRHFAQLGADDPDAASRSTDQLGVFMPWSLGGVGLTWQDRRFWNADPQRFWMLSGTASLGPNVTLSAYFQSAQFEQKQNTFGVNLLIPLDSTSQLWAQTNHSEGKTRGGVGWTSNLPTGIGWGHRLYAEEDGRLAARLERRGAIADWRGDLDVRNGNTYFGAGMSGSLVFMGGHLRASRRIGDSFALLKVGDLPGVPVYRDHHEIGVTGRDGVIVINDLRPYQANSIHVDPNDLPMDAQFENLQLKLSPALGAGVFADLGISRVTPATFLLLAEDGEPVAPGTVVQVAGSADHRTVGYGGRLFEPDWSINRVYEGVVTGKPCLFRTPSTLTPDSASLSITAVCEEVSQ